MQYNNFFDLNKYKENPTATFFAICFMLFVVGFMLLQRSSCRIAEYIYSSDRLDTGSLPVICRVF